MTSQTKIDKRQQDRRTIMAALVAVLVARLVAQIPALAAALAWVDGLIAEAGIVSVPALALLQAIVVAAVILAYQRVAQWLGDRWPAVEKIMLGSDARPHYEPRHTQTAPVPEIQQHITHVLSEDEVARIAAQRLADKL